MQRSDQLFLQPFLITNMAENQAKQDPHSTPMKSTKARKLLQHGILLMEIFQQDSFTYSIGTNGKVQSLEHSAYTWFRSIDWDVCERLVQIVETCIQGELVDLCSQPNEISDEEFVRLFCEKILAPLEADFAVFYPKEDPDQVISRLSLPRMAPKAPASFIAKTKKPKVNIALDDVRNFADYYGPWLAYFPEKSNLPVASNFVSTTIWRERLESLFFFSRHTKSPGTEILLPCRKLPRSDSVSSSALISVFA